MNGLHLSNVSWLVVRCPMNLFRFTKRPNGSLSFHIGSVGSLNKYIKQRTTTSSHLTSESNSFTHTLLNCPHLHPGPKSCGKERYYIDGQTHQKGYCHAPEYGDNDSQHG
jgi:hypothetical protein